MNRQPLSRREAVALGARWAATAAFGSAVAPWLRAADTNSAPRRIFDVLDFGAVGDGAALDTAALQRAIDAAGASISGGNRAQVLVRGGRRYLTGSLQLQPGIEFYLADDAELLASTKPEHYGDGGALLNARDAAGLRIAGTGTVNGRSPEFMVRYDAENEWWRPGAFRPKLFHLIRCPGLEVRDLTVKQAPSWSLHLLGCVGVRVDGIKIRNQLDVPNCDGIDLDHCRDVEVSRCDIVCGDDAIVIKTTRAGADYGPSARIAVRDCTIETQDSGLKIGTETTQDVQDVTFERCEIRASCRGLCIQLRDEGNVSGITFQDIHFTSRHFSAPWWGAGEAISLTAIPRAPSTKIGAISRVRIRNVTGRAENSVRVSGSPGSRIRDVELDNVAVTLDSWTKYPGGFWDNRPTTAQPGKEPHGTPGYAIRYADNVTLRQCRVAWGANRPDGFTHALEADHVTGLQYSGFAGDAAHPERDPAVVIS
jgi:polygalacturonase